MYKDKEEFLPNPTELGGPKVDASSKDEKLYSFVDLVKLPAQQTINIRGIVDKAMVESGIGRPRWCLYH